MIFQGTSNNFAEAIQYLENSIRILARIFVKAVMTELLDQETTFGQAGRNLTATISSNANKPDQQGKSLVFSVSEAARLLGISKGTAYTLVQTGQIPSIKWGKRMLIPRVALMKMLEDAGTSTPASTR